MFDHQKLLFPVKQWQLCASNDISLASLTLTEVEKCSLELRCVLRDSVQYIHDDKSDKKCFLSIYYPLIFHISMDANHPEKFLFESWRLNEQLEQPVTQRGRQIQP